MTRTEVRALFKSAVDLLSPAVQFNSGRISEFTSQANKSYPFVWLEPLQVSTEFTTIQSPIDSWECVAHIAKQDKMDSLPVQYEAIVDECDLIAQKLIHNLNQVVSGYKLITISGVTREPFIKKISDATSGVIISFTLISDDKTNVC